MTLVVSVDSSEATRETSNTVGLVNSDTKDWFQQWFVGVTDGDGSFTYSKSGGKWSIFFKIGQSTSNLRLLHYIKNNLGVGSVLVDKDNDMASFRIRGVAHVVEYILPIFDKYPLLTSKHFNYSQFKKAVLIMYDTTLTPVQKDVLLTNLQKVTMPENYISPAWEPVNYKVMNLIDAMMVMSKPWLVGFTEASGSFFIVLKGPSRLVHSFAITQKLDRIVLTAIGFILGIEVQVKNTYLSIGTSNSRTIQTIVDYFFKTMKGMKSVEYRIWARSYLKGGLGRKGFDYLNAIREQMRTLRSYRLDMNFKVSHYKKPRDFNK